MEEAQALMVKKKNIELELDTHLEYLQKVGVCLCCYSSPVSARLEWTKV
jgi:hypothetical protein